MGRQSVNKQVSEKKKAKKITESSGNWGAIFDRVI